MEVDFASPQDGLYERIIEKKEIGLLGFVVIDTAIGNGGTGGIRMAEGVTLDEIRALAREMTLKFAWLNIPRAGAKSGIIAPNSMTPSDKERLCCEFGRQISDLLRGGRYMAGEDLGIGAADYELIRRAAGMQTSTAATFVDSNYFTALTVLVTSQVLIHAQDRSLADVSVLLEGFGKVGSNLVRLFHDSGALIVGVSTAAGAVYDRNGLDVEVLLRLRDEHGDECVRFFPSGEQIRPDQLILQSADLLIPGARPYCINAGNLEEIKASMIVPIANIPATEAIERSLFRRGIRFVPGFVSNCGGILSWQLAKFTDESREELIRTLFARKVERLIAYADNNERSISDVARENACQNLRRMQQERSGLVSHRVQALLRKLAPNRLGYAIGRRVLGKTWGSRATPLCRWHYRATLFR